MRVRSGSGNSAAAAPRRTAIHRRAALVVRAATTATPPDADARALAGCQVLSAATGAPVELLSLWRGVPGERVVVPFLTHCGDLTSREFAQKLQRKALAPLADAGVKVGGGR